ncbi:hypothetical protein Efla_005444 [Eimeria flavescens]
MDGFSEAETHGVLPGSAEQQHRALCACAASISAAPIVASPRQAGCSPKLGTPGDPGCPASEGSVRKQASRRRRLSAATAYQRAAAAIVEAHCADAAGVLPPLRPYVSLENTCTRSCWRRDALPLFAASPAAAPTAAAAAAGPLQRPSVDNNRRRTPAAAKSPLLLLPTSSGSSSSRSSSSSAAPVDLFAALTRELTCPICLEIFRLPVTVMCGHSFCRYCIGHKKLNRKACPLCRQDIGESFAVNTVLCNLLACFGSDRQQLLHRPRRHGSPASPVFSLHAASLVDDAWWAQHCIKQRVAAPLAIRLLLPAVAEESGLLLDDLVACVIDAFDRKSLWAEQKWCFTLRDAETFCRMVGFDRQDQGEQTPSATRDRLHRWVESYVSALPSVCSRRGGNGADTSASRFVVRVMGDRVHRIDSQSFDSRAVQQGLPWDMGRHQSSLLHVPHSSVSLSHLLLLRERRDGCLRIVDLGSTIGTMVKVSGVRALQCDDLIHIGDRVEVSVELHPAPLLGRRRENRADRKKLKAASDSGEEAKVAECPYLLSQWNDALGKVVGPAVSFTHRSLDSPASEQDAAAAASAAAGSVRWKPSKQGAEEQPTTDVWHPAGRSCGAAGAACSSSIAEEGTTTDGGRGGGSRTRQADSDSSSNVSMSEASEAEETEGDGQPAKHVEGQAMEEDAEHLQPVASFLLLKIHGSGRQKPREVWADPRGVLLGRGPQNSTAGIKKLSVTASNGYVSRQHCLVYYDGRQPAGSRWMLKDMSTLGTFIRLKPLEPYACSLSPRTVFKVGQCKVEVAPWTLQQQQSQSAPVDAPTERLPQQLPRLPASPLSALPTREHLRDLARELERHARSQTAAAGLTAGQLASSLTRHADSQLPRLPTSFPVFLSWGGTGSQGPHRGTATDFMQWRIYGSEAEAPHNPSIAESFAVPTELPAAAQPRLWSGGYETQPLQAWQVVQRQQPQPQPQRTTRPSALEPLAELPLDCCPLPLPGALEEGVESPLNRGAPEGLSGRTGRPSGRGCESTAPTRGHSAHLQEHYEETAATLERLMSCLTSGHLPQLGELPQLLRLRSNRLNFQRPREGCCGAAQPADLPRRRGSDSANREAAAAERSNVGEPTGLAGTGLREQQASVAREADCAMPERNEEAVARGSQPPLEASDSLLTAARGGGSDDIRTAEPTEHIAAGCLSSCEISVATHELSGHRREGGVPRTEDALGLVAAALQNECDAGLREASRNETCADCDDAACSEPPTELLSLMRSTGLSQEARNGGERLGRRSSLWGPSSSPAVFRWLS